jgi:hypothetical protein
VVRQSPVTVRARVSPGRLGDLEQLLANRHPGAASRLRLGELGTVHFARLFVLEAAVLTSGEEIPASLVYMADVDGSTAEHLRTVARTAPTVVDELFGHCEGYPSTPSAGTRLAWLLAHSRKPAARYVHTAGRSVTQVHDEARAYECLGDIVDAGEVPIDAGPPTLLRDRLRAALLRRSDTAWARKPPPGRGLVDEVRDSVHLFAGLAVGVAVAPVALPAAVLWLVLVRLQELHDTQEEGAPDQGHVDAVRQYEDFGAQNPFTAVGEVKPGLVRQVTMRVALAGLDFANRHAFARDTLAGVDSIHFARWVLLDDNRRLIFASSYDGSLESYMDDFISRLSWGINLVFSNGVGFPRARWLVLDGSRDEISYKHYLRRHQAATPVYYSAYPQHTARNLDTFTHVHGGLASGYESDEDAELWLARL